MTAPHRKVRTGCMKCKKRRVKCDETKPSCLKCQARGETCRYTLQLIHATPLMREHALRPHTFSILDMELLHQWTDHTGASLAGNQMILRKMLQTTMPRLALKHSFLMNALLSLSALHKARLEQHHRVRYMELACRYQTVSLPLFQRALEATCESSCAAVYACSHLVAKYALAKLTITANDESFQPQEALMELITLLKGGWVIINTWFSQLADGPVGNCLESCTEPGPDDAATAIELHLQEILDQILDDDDSENNEAYQISMDNLRRTFAMIALPNQLMSMKTLVFAWLAQLPTRYVQLLSTQNPRALVIMAHYCILLHKIEPFWFMSGWSFHMLQYCLHHLGKDWQHLVEWPITEIFKPFGAMKCLQEDTRPKVVS